MTSEVSRVCATCVCCYWQTRDKWWLRLCRAVTGGQTTTIPPHPNPSQPINFYLLSHVSNSSHLPPQKAVTFYKTFLQILPNPRETIYFFCPAALALFANLFDFPRVLCSPLSSGFALFPCADWRRADRANQAFTASFLLTHLPAFPWSPPKVFQRKHSLMEFTTWLLHGHTAGYSPTAPQTHRLSVAVAAMRERVTSLPVISH